MGLRVGRCLNNMKELNAYLDASLIAFGDEPPLSDFIALCAVSVIAVRSMILFLPLCPSF